MNQQLVQKMTRIAMQDPSKRIAFIKTLKENPALRNALKEKIASETDPYQKAKQTIKDFEDILPEVKNIKLETEMKKEAKTTSKSKKKFSPETMVLVKEFNEKFKRLGDKYDTKTKSLQDEIKREVKEAMEEKKRLATEEGLSKEQKKKVLRKFKKKLEGPLMKKIEETLADFKKEQKALAEEYAKKDPDFKKASGHLNFGQKIWKVLNTPYKSVLLPTETFGGFIVLLILVKIVKIAIISLAL